MVIDGARVTVLAPSGVRRMDAPCAWVAAVIGAWVGILAL